MRGRLTWLVMWMMVLVFDLSPSCAEKLGGQAPPINTLPPACPQNRPRSSNRSLKKTSVTQQRPSVFRAFKESNAGRVGNRVGRKVN